MVINESQQVTHMNHYNVLYDARYYISKVECCCDALLVHFFIFKIFLFEGIDQIVIGWKHGWNINMNGWINWQRKIGSANASERMID